MANPIVWGPFVWKVMFDQSVLVDRAIDEKRSDALQMARDMQLMITVASFCYPCDQCSYYGIEFVVACPVPLSRFAEYLFDMKATVDAKIKTVQYDKHQVEECIPPHLSRISFMQRNKLVSKVSMDDWAIFTLLAARHAQDHTERDIRIEALNKLLECVFRLNSMQAPSHVESFDDVVGIWRGQSVDLDKAMRVVQVAFE